MQFLNAPRPSCFVSFGMCTFVRLAHWIKTSSSMRDRDEGNSIVFSDLQFANARLPIERMLAGIVIDVKLVQPENVSELADFRL